MAAVSPNETSPNEASPNETPSPAYVLFILAVSVLGLLLLAVETVCELDAATRTILACADTFLCFLFFLDFLITLRRARHRRQYLLTWGWLDVASSVPVISAFRIGRFARVFRLVRILRGIRATRILTTLALERRAQSAFLAAALVLIIFIVFGSIAILQVERGPTASIRSPQDALWWTVAAITSADYGNRGPVTPEGRMVGTVLMVVGVALFGTLSGFVASWFLAPQEREQEGELKALRAEIAALRETLERREGVAPTASTPAGSRSGRR